ncbi:hypothetical protein N8376_05450 [Flavobacteriaceae bacterium]|nr:hypothetical protein [Flavobacteriaceae bacterium]MDC1492780.1 hypothetical protein [Flavobacteriaceae bacterium]
MKKLLYIFLFSLLFFSCDNKKNHLDESNLKGKVKSKYPRVEKIVTQDKIFNGRIDKYPITIYLKYEQFSNYHLGVYSVQGWYYYDTVKTKIPLTGLYNGSNLTLYHFGEVDKSNELLNFREMKSNHWDDMEYYENLKEYKEKFVLGDNKNYWLNGSKSLEVQLYQEDLSIQNVNEYLLLDSKTAFNLQNFGGGILNFELIAHENGKFILQYEHGSRHYVMGQCGAGTEEGFFELEFNNDNNLIRYQEFVIGSCNSSISNEKKEKINDQITIYHCYDYRNENSYALTVDKGKLSIEKEEKN